MFLVISTPSPFPLQDGIGHDEDGNRLPRLPVMLVDSRFFPRVFGLVYFYIHSASIKAAPLIANNQPYSIPTCTFLSTFIAAPTRRSNTLALR